MIVAHAVAVHTDDLIDTGPAAGRAPAFHRWAGQVRDALDTQDSEQSLLRAYLHTQRVQGTPDHWMRTFLEGIATDLEFAGFATAGAYQQYVERMAWPCVMLSFGLQNPGGPDPDTSAHWRTFADATQRLDFLADLAEDLRAGRLCLPAEDLQRHGVTHIDLRTARDTPGVRALLADATARTRAALTDRWRRPAGCLRARVPPSGARLAQGRDPAAGHHRAPRPVLDPPPGRFRRPRPDPSPGQDAQRAPRPPPPSPPTSPPARCAPGTRSSSATPTPPSRNSYDPRNRGQRRVSGRVGGGGANGS